MTARPASLVREELTRSNQLALRRCLWRALTAVRAQPAARGNPHRRNKMAAHCLRQSLTSLIGSLYRFSV